MAEKSITDDHYDTHGEITLAGSANAYTGETARAIVSYYNGLLICAEANHENTGAATLNLNSIGAGNIKLTDGSDPAAGNIQNGGKYFFIHDGTNWQLLNPYDTGAAAGSIGTTELADEAVTYAKMQHVSATSRVLGRKTAGAGDVEECTLSEVLDFVGSAAQGDVLYRGASGWARLAAGTSGQVLQTQGASANPQWADSGGAIVALIEDQQTAGTDGQALTSGADRTRTLNALTFNRDTTVVLSSNQFTLPAGTWLIKWFAPAGSDAAGATQHQSLLHNATDTADVSRGISCSVDPDTTGADEETSISAGAAVVTIASSKAFEIRHRVSNTMNGGHALGVGGEVYTRVEIYSA